MTAHPRASGEAWHEVALVLVDLQQDFYPDVVATAHPGLPAATSALVTHARAKGAEVVHLRASFQPDGSDWMARYRLRGRIPCVAGTPGAEPLDFGRPVDGEVLIERHGFDGFLRTGLDAHLRDSGRRVLLVAGLVTSTCVLFTASTATAW